MAVLHPQINPVALDLGFVELHWYGLMYLLAFAAAYFLAWYRTKSRSDFTAEMVSDLVFFGSLGVILGGRIGYVILYNFSEFISNPSYLFRVWEGGMSFHGGFIGVLLAMWYFAHKYKKAPFTVLDFIAPCVPTGLLFGRIGNFINGELWGRHTDMPWGVVFPKVDNLPRHPSQLYQAFLEGIVLFVLLNWYRKMSPPMGAMSGLFLIGYGVARILAEFFREPDQQIGYLAWGWLTEGQLLSLPMLFIGAFFIWGAYHRVKGAKA